MRGVWLALLVALGMLFGGLGRFPLLKPDEVRNAEVAREMYASGSWVVPTFNGLPYLDKPALHFRVVAVSFSLFGVNEAAARLPSAVAGLALLVGLYLFARRHAGSPIAALAVIVVATTPLFIVFARLVILDMLFTLCVSLAILAGYHAEEGEGRTRRRWHLAGAVCTGLAVLVKGPVGLLLPWLVLILFYVVDRRPRAILRLLAPLNIGVVLALVLPWFLALSHQRPDFPYYGLVVESFERLTTGTFRRQKPFYFYLPLIAGTCVAWSVLLPSAAAAAWRARRGWTRLDRFSLVWLGAVVVFFSIPQSKQPGYILSVTLPLGLLLAKYVAAGLRDPAGRVARALRGSAMILGGVFTVLGAGVVAVIVRPSLPLEWAQATTDQVDQMLPHLGPLAASCLVVAVMAWLAAYRKRVGLIFGAFAALVPLLAFVNFSGLDAYARVRSQADMLDRLPALPPETEIASVMCFPQYFPFYMQRTVTLLTEDGEEFPSNYIPYYLAHQTNWPAQVVHMRDAGRWLASRRHPVYLIRNRHSGPWFDEVAAGAGVTEDDLGDQYKGILLQPGRGR